MGYKLVTQNLVGGSHGVKRHSHHHRHIVSNRRSSTVRDVMDLGSIVPCIYEELRYAVYLLLTRLRAVMTSLPMF